MILIWSARTLAGRARKRVCREISMMLPLEPASTVRSKASSSGIQTSRGASKSCVSSRPSDTGTLVTAPANISARQAEPAGTL